MKVTCLLTVLLAVSCSSNIPDDSYARIHQDVEWFTAALLDRRVDTVIRHFQKRGVKNPVKESIKLIKRETDFYEIWNTRTKLEFSIDEDENQIFATATLPSTKILKMIWIDGEWYYFDFSTPE